MGAAIAIPIVGGAGSLALYFAYVMLYGGADLISYIASFFNFQATPRGVSAFAAQTRRPPQDVMKEVAKKLPGFSGNTFNVGFIGSSGSGKSTLVGALVKQRLLSSSIAECTRAASCHPHPDIKNVSLWDLPGTGTVRSLVALFHCKPLRVPSPFPSPTLPFPHPQIDQPLQGFYEDKCLFALDAVVITCSDRVKESSMALARKAQQYGQSVVFAWTKADEMLQAMPGDRPEVPARKRVQHLKESVKLTVAAAWAKAFPFPDAPPCPPVMLVSAHDMRVMNAQSTEDSVAVWGNKRVLTEAAKEEHVRWHATRLLLTEDNSSDPRVTAEECCSECSNSPFPGYWKLRKHTLVYEESALITLLATRAVERASETAEAGFQEAACAAARQAIESQCPICTLCEERPSDIQLICSSKKCAQLHAVCTTCADGWLVGQRSTTCPFCRGTVTGRTPRAPPLLPAISTALARCGGGSQSLPSAPPASLSLRYRPQENHV